MAQHLNKTENLLFWYVLPVLGRRFEPFFICRIREAETLFHLFDAVQRVAYPQPIDGDVLVVSERFVSEHGIFQVAELDERIAQCFIGKPLQHVTEDNLCLPRY